MMGNKNAVKDGRYSGVPRANLCSNCPRMSFCPHFKWGNACVFLCEKLEKMAANLTKRGWLP
jgi:hypothetical protein